MVDIKSFSTSPHLALIDIFDDLRELPPPKTYDETDFFFGLYELLRTVARLTCGDVFLAAGDINF